MTTSRFRFVLILFVPVIIFLKIAHVDRIFDIPCNYYLWLIFFFFLLLRHIFFRFPIYNEGLNHFVFILFIFCFINFLAHDYSSTLFLKRFGIFMVFLFIPAIVSHSFGVQRNTDYLLIYHQVVFVLALSFLFLFIIGYTRDGFYLPGSNRNAVVFLFTPTFCYFWQYRQKEGILKLLILTFFIFTTLSRAVFILLGLSFIYELIFSRKPLSSGVKKMFDVSSSQESVVRLARRLRLPILTIIPVVSLAVYFMTQFNPGIKQSFNRLPNVLTGRLYLENIPRTESDGRRSTLMTQAKKSIMESPFFGVGFGGFLPYLNQFHHERYHLALPHSLPLTLLAENGILGTVLIIFIYSLLYKDALLLSYFRNANRMTFFIIFGISMGNEYLITSPWFYLWLGLVTVKPQFLKRYGITLQEVDDHYKEYDRFNLTEYLRRRMTNPNYAGTYKE